jgi:hypothetical protein
MRDRLLLLAAILAQSQHSVVSSEALELLYQAMQALLYWRTATALKMASKVGAFFVVVVFPVALAAAGAIRSK